MATHSSILAGKFHGQRRLAGYCPRGHKESETTERAHCLMTLFSFKHFVALVKKVVFQ